MTAAGIVGLVLLFFFKIWLIDPLLDFVLFFLLTIVPSWFVYQTNEKLADFAYYRSGFGYNFRNLCSLLDKTPDELFAMNESALIANATTALKQSANEVRKAEEKDADHFQGAGSEKDSLIYEYERSRKRSRFSDNFEVARSFGLTAKTWTPYFAADEEAPAAT